MLDEYGVATNSEALYRSVAEMLQHAGAYISWTDGRGTHYEIVFTLRPATIQGNQHAYGLRGGELFVGIVYKGCWGFKTDGRPLFPAYVNEKLDIGDDPGNPGPTSIALTDLIKGVIWGLAHQQQ